MEMECKSEGVRFNVFLRSWSNDFTLKSAQSSLKLKTYKYKNVQMYKFCKYLIQLYLYFRYCVEK